MNSTTYSNQIIGLKRTYKAFEVIRFEAVGFGQDNITPREGDIRFIPTLWRASPLGSWEAPPYKAYFSIAHPGFYKLQVFFRKDIYQNNRWMPQVTLENMDELECIEDTFIVTPIKS